MANLNVQSTVPSIPVASPTPTKAAAKAPEQATEKPALAKDAIAWADVPKSERVSAATSIKFKQTIVPYAVGGALVPAATGAVLGGFIGLFSGNAGKFAVEGAKMGLNWKFVAGGAAVGATIATAESAVMGGIVGTAPDKQSAMTRAGVASGILGLLTAENKMDVIGAGIGAAAESVSAGRLFDKAEAAVTKK